MKALFVMSFSAVFVTALTISSTVVSASAQSVCKGIKDSKVKAACYAGTYVGRTVIENEAYDVGKKWLSDQYNNVRNCRTVCYDNGTYSNSTPSYCERVCN
jgi:hypothetical protein